MKVLVADSNESLCGRLANEIGELGYTVEKVLDGKGALERLQASDAPQVAFLSADLEGLQGADVCSAVRKGHSNDSAHSIHPYIILIVESNNPDHFQKGMDAGADDFLSDRWHGNDIQVKMRLAERNFDLQSALQSHITELEKVLRRHNLLREVMSKRSPAEQERAAADEAKLATSEPPSKVNFSEKLASIPVIGNLHETIADVFSQLGCGRATATIPTGVTLAQDLRHLVWTPMFLCNPEAWIDIKVEMNDNSAHRLYTEMLGVKPQSESDLNDALSEMLNIVQGALKGAFAKVDVPSKTLTLPRMLSAHGIRLPTTVVGNFEKCEVTIGEEIKALFTIIIHDAPIQTKPIDEIVEYDILDKDFFSPQNNATPISREGTILDAFNMRKLNSFKGQAEAVAMVIEPSRVGRRCMAVG